MSVSRGAGASARRRMLRIGLAVVGCLFCVPLTASGQGGQKDLQYRLNAEGLSALEAGDSDKAATLFRAALEVGELDLLYFNLGRALQKGGSCAEADQMFRKALTAPALGTPPHEVVVGAVKDSRLELERTCDGVLVVACDPPALQLTVDGVVSACGKDLSVAAGERLLVGTYDGRRETAKVAVRGLRRTEAKLVVPPAAAAIPTPSEETVDGPDPGPTVGATLPEPGEPDASDAGWRAVTAWTLLGVGAVSVAGGAVFSVLTQQTRDDLEALAADRHASVFDANRAAALDGDLDTYKTAQLLTYGTGAALGAAALVLWLWGSDEPDQALLVPWGTPTGSGVLEGRF